jgi:uncharacterized protein (DUF2252 family)
MKRHEANGFPQVAERARILIGHQRRKMARSAHAYVRGATRKFYQWLEQSTGHLIPEGPPIWICGDCHVGNLGPVADSEGNVTIQIRDLDQTVIGNPAHDLIRLGLSLATAARGSDLPGVTVPQKTRNGFRRPNRWSRCSRRPFSAAGTIWLKNALRTSSRKSRSASASGP